MQSPCGLAAVEQIILDARARLAVSPSGAEAALGARDKFRRATIKVMGSVLAWLLASSVALVMWLLLLWAEGRTRDRQGRKNGS